MDPQIILSGKGKFQLMVEGYRYRKTRGPAGPNETCYFVCVVEKCLGTAATTGNLSTEDVNVKYHNLPTNLIIIHQTYQ